MALVAAAMTVLYAQFVLYEGMLLASTLEIFFFTASFALALALDDDLKGERPVKLGGRRVPPWASGIVLGILIGAGALGRPNLFLLLIAALPVWLLRETPRGPRMVDPRRRPRRRSRDLPRAPDRLQREGDRPARSRDRPRGDSISIIGNGPGSTGVFRPPVDMRSSMQGVMEDSRTKAEAETGRAMTQAEVSEYYFRETLEYIADNPAAWLRLLGKKLVLFFNVDVPDIPNVFFCMKLVRRSQISLSALFGDRAARHLRISDRAAQRKEPERHFPFSRDAPSSRSSLSSSTRATGFRRSPMLILLASFFAVWAAREISRRRLKRLAGMAALAVALYLLVSSRPLIELNNGATYSFLGKYYAEHNDEAKAQDAFAEAYRLDPNKVEAIVSYARILRQRGQDARSGRYVRAGVCAIPPLPARRRGIRHGARSSRATRRGEEALPRRRARRTARWSGLSRAGSSPARRSRRATGTRRSGGSNGRSSRFRENRSSRRCSRSSRAPTCREVFGREAFDRAGPHHLRAPFAVPAPRRRLRRDFVKPVI